MNFETIDWQAEAIRVARAFGVDDECEFRRRAPKNQHVTMTLYRVGQPSDLITGLENGFTLGVVYSRFGRFYGVGEGQHDRQSHCMIGWDGTAAVRRVGDLATLHLVKGLFHLNLLTPSIEASLKISISAHQKIEWALEYRTRYAEPSQGEPSP